MLTARLESDESAQPYLLNLKRSYLLNHPATAI